MEVNREPERHRPDRVGFACDPRSAHPMSPPGLEPGAYCLGGSRSIHLSYGDCMNLHDGRPYLKLSNE